MDHSQPLFYLSLSFQQSTVKIYSVRNFANDRIRIMDLCNLNRLSGCHWAYLYRLNLKKAFGSVYSFWSQELLPLLQFEPRLAPIISTNFRLVIKLPDNLKHINNFQCTPGGTNPENNFKLVKNWAVGTQLSQQLKRRFVDFVNTFEGRTSAQ